MFADLTPQERQRVAQAYMPQMGGKSPADANTMLQMLMNNPDMAAQAMSMYNNASGGNNNSGGTGAGSRIEDLLTGLMSNSETSAPIPPSRPKDVAVKSNNPNNVMPPSKPVELTGEDRVAKAGGPGSPRGNSASNATATANEEGVVDPSMSSTVMSVLASMGLGGAGAYGAYKYLSRPKQMPNEVAAEPMPNSKAMTLPPEAGGEVVPRTATNIQDRFSQAFADDIPDAQYREVAPLPAPKTSKAPTEETKQVGETKKLTGPKEVDDRDNVKKADGKTITAEDETEDAGVKRTMNKATTAKEKLKPKVRVK